MLPLIAGIVVGAGAVVAVNNRKELKEKISTGAKVAGKTATKAKDTMVEKVKSVTNKEEDGKKGETEKVETTDDK